MNRVVTLVKRVFCQSPLRRHLYREYMIEKGVEPKLLIYAVLTRWGSWVNAVSYLADYLVVLRDFLHSGNVTSDSAYFCELQTLLSTSFDGLYCEALFIKKYGGKLVSTLEKLESKSIPLAHSLYSIIEDVHLFMEYGCIEDELDPDIATNLASWTEESKHQLILSFQEVFSKSATKLALLWDTHPCHKLYELEYLIPSSSHYYPRPRGRRVQ